VNIIPSAKRFILQKSLATFYEAGMMIMRKDPDATRKKFIAEGKWDEGMDDVLTMPDFVVKHLAECTAEVIVDDPRMAQILKGEAQIESAKLTEKMAERADVVKWFEEGRKEERSMV
jgi:hypothetical protein